MQLVTPHRMATRREWLGLVVLVLPCLLVSMDLSVLFYALPFLSADLAPSSSQLLWILDLYGFVLAGFLISMGTLGDRIGRRKVLLAGAALFGLASVAAAYAQSTEMLIAARAVLGIAGATLAPSTLSLIRNMFHDPRQRQVAVSVWTLGFAGGAIVGPIVGGFMLEHFWWGSVFLLNVPVMVLLLVLGPALLPEFRNPKAGRFDLLGAVLSLATILPVIYGIKKLAADGFAWEYVGSIALGLAFGATFLRRMSTAEHPMVDVRLFRRAQFSGAVGACAITFLVLAGLGMFVSQYLQLVLGYGPLEAALWCLPGMAGMLVGVSTATAIAAKLKPSVIVASGLVLSGAGFALFAQVSVESGVAWVVASQIVLAGGIGAVATISTDLVLATAPKESAGAAAAISETANEFGGATGIALLGSLGAVVYRNDLELSAPDGLPAEVLVQAKETLGSAFEAAASLPTALGDALRFAASSTFVNGVQWVAWIGAGGSVVVAAFVLLVLRRVPPTAPNGGGHDPAR
ncbi:MFS transporter [Kibdelosporangium aridum]|uniref:MFS transporter, DHA2 family, multidrug resistance protein n=1 Tax=Kibdelosporangium aridum TaxID=2030 RepID=A0A1Y5Y8J3_KIBAR|nr:MFS transporter [Kibdelosporangium aridum]SMD25666.1 MFS transporter, DHA2 family, multidrug resistance protein [Kibdelosporangium aridum]